MRSSGFSLIELLIALSLGSLAIAGAMALVTNLSLAHIKGQKELSAEMSALAAVRQAERQLRQTTMLTLPAPGTTGDVLEGCGNAMVRPGDAAPTALDGSAPMVGYAFCSVSGVLYYHASGACPPAYVCGTDGIPLAGSPGRSSASTTFIRAAKSSVVDVNVVVTAGGSASRARSSAAAAFSPGMNP